MIKYLYITLYINPVAKKCIYLYAKHYTILLHHNATTKKIEVNRLFYLCCMWYIDIILFCGKSIYVYI